MGPAHSLAQAEVVKADVAVDATMPHGLTEPCGYFY